MNMIEKYCNAAVVIACGAIVLLFAYIAAIVLNLAYDPQFKLPILGYALIVLLVVIIVLFVYVARTNKEYIPTERK